MMNPITKMILIFSLAITIVKASSLDSLVYMTEEYAPANYTQDGIITGATVEILKAMWFDMGEIEKDIQMMPWARAYDDIQKKDNCVLFAMARSPSRETMFKWVGPLYHVNYVLVAKKNRNVQIKSLLNLGKTRIGVVRNDISQILLTEKGVKNVNLTIVSRHKQSLEMLAMNRIDAVCVAHMGYKDILSQSNLNPNDYEIVYTVKGLGNYYAFSKSVPDSIIEKFQKSFEKIEDKRSKILEKFGIPNM